jgi:hypothetical protein
VDRYLVQVDLLLFCWFTNSFIVSSATGCLLQSCCVQNMHNLNLNGFVGQFLFEGTMNMGDIVVSNIQENSNILLSNVFAYDNTFEVESGTSNFNVILGMPQICT